MQFQLPDPEFQPLPSFVYPQVLKLVQQYPAIPIQPQPVDHQLLSIPQRGQSSADLQIDNDPHQGLTSPPQHQPVDHQVGQTSARAKAGEVHVQSRSSSERVRTQQAGAAPTIPTEVATPNVINPIEPVRALQHPTMPHRQGCPCRGFYIDRPSEHKITKSGAPLDVFASIVGDAAAAVYVRTEENNYTMSAHAGLPSTKFKHKQQQLVEENLHTDPLRDSQGDPIEFVPSLSMLKEQVLKRIEQGLQELTERNKTFTTVPPCVADGIVSVDDYIKCRVWA